MNDKCIRPGDFIQWTAGGIDQFTRLRRVSLVSECGDYVFVYGSNTGIPVEQISKHFSYDKGFKEYGKA